MQFFTKVPILETQEPIDYNSKIVSIGSCFAANMGQKFEFYKFQNTTNPFGIIFNPFSIEKLIRRAISNNFFTEDEIFFHNERWQSFDIHSELSHPNGQFFLNNVNEKLVSFNKQLSTATHLIVTLGTAWVYRINESDEIVANCHKIPQKQFSKNLLSTTEISSALNSVLHLVSAINPNCHFIITVSPVRHIKDGFTENQVSKSHLLSAVYEVVQQQFYNAIYFPSYEIMMDELRDYRFYGEDLLHPNVTAMDYIWSRFTETNINPVSFSTMDEVKTIQMGLQHRSFNPDSVSHQNFQKKLEAKIEAVQKSFPLIHF